MPLQKVIACQDDSCHWYVIPAGMYDQFRILLDDEEHEQVFEEKFSKYRTNGNLNNVQLWAEIK